MSVGGSGRVSIPIDIKKMIDDIKEITVYPTEDEIYAMLKECSMDPNETIQKLLLQGIIFFFSFLLSLFDFLIGCWLGAACMGLILVIHVLLLVFSLLGFVAFGLLCNGFDFILVFLFLFIEVLLCGKWEFF